MDKGITGQAKTRILLVAVELPVYDNLSASV